MKRFWIFSGATYYPGGGMTDFVGHKDTLGEAEELAFSQYVENGGKSDDGFHLAWAHVFDSEIGEIVHMSGNLLPNDDLEKIESAVKN